MPEVEHNTEIYKTLQYSCSYAVVNLFQKFLKTQQQIQCFRWINIEGLADQSANNGMGLDYFQPDHYDDLNQIISINCRTDPVGGGRGIYLNPYIGDLQRDLIEAIYKCRYMDK